MTVIVEMNNQLNSQPSQALSSQLSFFSLEKKE